MKLLIDEMPVMSNDCPFFGYYHCELDGDSCGLWRKEQRIDDDAECQCLTEFKPFRFEPEFKAVFTKDHKLVKEANGGKHNITRQIEEMTKIMNECCNVYDEQGNHIRNKCYECECWSDDNHCCCSYNTKEAEALYAAGYRKQSEGEWLLIKVPTGVELYGIREVQAYPKCSLCGYMGDVSEWHFRYCPNCGAKMKGGAE